MMNQRQITHPAGTFAACGTCKQEPRHYVGTGRLPYEGLATAIMPERHLMECPCRRCSGWRQSLDEAERAWGLLGETLPLLLVQRPASNVRALRSATKGRAQG